MSLKRGDKAPDFECPDQNGNMVKLSNFLGKKIIIYFYPKDNTPGCTAQSCNLRDYYPTLEEKNYVVLGISGDGQESHQHFISKYSLPFTLLSDSDKQIHEMYETWRMKNVFGKMALSTMRHTFIIDEKGYIQDIIKRVKTKTHTQQILDLDE